MEGFVFEKKLDSHMFVTKTHEETICAYDESKCLFLQADARLASNAVAELLAPYKEESGQFFLLFFLLNGAVQTNFKCFFQENFMLNASAKVFYKLISE